MAPATIKDLARELNLLNTYMTSSLDPPLTTVAQPSDEIGKTAAQLLITQINSNDEHLVPKFIALQTNLSARGST